MTQKEPRKKREHLIPRTLRQGALGSTLLGAGGGGYLGHKIRTKITQDRLDAIAVRVNQLRRIGGTIPKKTITGRGLGRGIITAGALGGGAATGMILGVPLLVGSALTSGLNRR